MDFIYYYKTSDGVRREAEISAPTRDEAFAALRKQGIRPMKVVSKEGTRANGEVKFVGKRFVFSALVAGLIVGGVLVFIGNDKEAEFYKADGTMGVERKEKVCVPMVRRQIFGDRAKVDSLMRGGANLIFSNKGEVFLSQFAEPGRTFPKQDSLALDLEKALLDSLKVPIYTFSDEMQECVELKNIVAGMKEELRMFLASGGSVKEYITRLVSRQEMEITHRENAQENLAKALRETSAKEALAAWHGLNAWLNAMGIEKLPLPLELEEVEKAEDTTKESAKSRGISTPTIRLPLMER